jgi:hypothetical protein
LSDSTAAATVDDEDEEIVSQQKLGEMEMEGRRSRGE